MKILIIYIVVILAGIISFVFSQSSFPKSIWECFVILDTSSAVALAILAGYGYWEFVRNEQAIKIYFKTEKKSKIDTHLSILRKNFTRAELLGVLGMIQKNPKERFEIESLKNISVLTDLQNIQKSNNKDFYIKASEKELGQFNLL